MIQLTKGSNNIINVDGEDNCTELPLKFVYRTTTTGCTTRNFNINVKDAKRATGMIQTLTATLQTKTQRAIETKSTS